LQLVSHWSAFGFPIVGAAWRAAGIAALWLAFGVWYLRASRIAALGLGTLPFDQIAARPPVRGIVSKQTDFSLCVAPRIWFTASPPRALWLELPGQLLIAAALLALLRYLPGQAAGRVPPVLAAAFLVFPPMVFFVANAMARRARHLWLKVAWSRQGLFRAVERISIRQAVPMLVLMLFLAVGFPLVDAGMSYARASGLFAVAVTGSVLAFYAGFAAVRGALAAWAVAVIVVLLASQCIAAWAVLIEPFRSEVYAGVLLFHVAVAALLRGRAAESWRRIDWLAFKPVRTAAGPGLPFRRL
jgi:hypothetical protein